MSEKYAPNELPSEVTRKLYTCYSISGWRMGEISIWDCNMTGEDYVLLAETEVTISIPEQGNLKSKVVEALEEEKKKLQAEHFVKMQELQEKIDSLLMLEYKPIEEEVE